MMDKSKVIFNNVMPNSVYKKAVKSKKKYNEHKKKIYKTRKINGFV